MKEIKDIKLGKNMAVKELAKQLGDSGFQAQNLGKAIDIIKEMIRNDAAIFLSFTSNMTASGLRGVIISMIKSGKIKAIVTSSGSIDEDIIRAKLPYLQGSFEADDAKLGKEGINRMGNIFVPNDRYQYLEEFSLNALEEIYKEKKSFTPSELLEKIGKKIEGQSFIKAAAEINVPIYCPGITDGAFGMQLAFFKKKHNDFEIDVLSDFNNIINQAMQYEKTAGIILGGGIAKHHTIISNLMNNGFDYAVYVNSSSPYRGSLSSATTEEAKSWGKVKEDAKSITIHGDASIIFPLLVAPIEEFL
ncbi:deoxyhypusine synthase [Candidatus Woesearchaeota archaeon]|nr:deoxyhypusine synthase [Candidatus Woesearchaeota archaeon]